MRFDIITIFPEAVEAYFNESILRRAREKKLIDIKIWNLRDFTTDKHHKTDDRVFGGGPGMVMGIEPLTKVLEKILKQRATPLIPLTLRGTKKKYSDSAPLKVRGARGVMIILLSAGGKQFDSKMAAKMAKKYKQIIFICGRYEGVDERIKKLIQDSGFKIQEVSVGPYVLTGGELPAMIIVDAVSRHIPGVLGKSESLEEKRYGVGVAGYYPPG